VSFVSLDGSLASDLNPGHESSRRCTREGDQ
jgi:hypothetical protein